MDYYFHDGRPPVFEKNPGDPDTTDWYYFILGGVYDGGQEVHPPALAPNETITSTDVLIENGMRYAGPLLRETILDPTTGFELRTVYAVRAKPTIQAGQGNMRITLRYSTQYDSDPGRENVDRSVDVPVESQ